MAFYSQFQRQTVFARHENQLFYPVVFYDGPKLTPAGEIYYTILFNDGWLKDVLARELIGSDLSCFGGNIHLCLGQRVIVSHMGDDHRGSVIDQIADDVRIRLDLVDQLQIFKIHQLRLSSDVSRPHLGSLDSFQSFSKQNAPVSGVQSPEMRIRRCSLTATKEEAPKEESEDIKAAAMALTSLSLSPGAKSRNAVKDHFVFPSSKTQDFKMSLLHGQVDEGYSDKILKPRSRSFEAPKIFNSRKRRTASLDLNSTAVRGQKLERAESWDTDTTSYESKSMKSDNASKAFKCMWRGCGRVLTSLPGIIRHVKQEHLGPKAEDPVEFYFNDLFLDDASIPSDDSSVSSGIDEDEVDEESGNEAGHEAAKGSSKMKIAGIDSRRESWPQKKQRSKFGREKTISGRVRSTRDKLGAKGIESSKKCRKVYGMQNKQLWCTQCRWKKACVRFGKQI